MSDINEQCPSCAQPLLGQFCHQCGEKKFSKKDLSSKTIFEHIFTSITEVDGKFISSFWLLISKPGQLTLDYMSGVRKKRLSPFQILLTINIVFFLVAAYQGHSAFTAHLQTHTRAC